MTMKKRMHQSAVLAVALTLFLAAWLADLPGRAAAAPPNPAFPNVTGFWSGEFSSVTGLGGLASLDVTDQDHHRFQGTFTFHPPSPIHPPNPMRVLGTVSRSGKISLVGRNDNAFLRAHGTVFRGNMLLDYQLNFADGSKDMGSAQIGLQTGNGP
jgi:hypothetical protein